MAEGFRQRTTVHRSAIASSIVPLCDDEVEIRMSTGQRARDGHILEPGGAVLDNYRANPIMLWSHNPEEPVGTNSNITVQGDAITARTTFAPTGISPTADMVRGMVKAGVIRTVSIGFVILDAEPIDRNRPRDGLRVSSWELLECSFVTVPSDTNAVVTARAARVAQLAAQPGFSPEERRLVAVAAEFDEVLTKARMAEIIAEARRIGRTPEFHLRWQLATRRAMRTATEDFAERRAEAQRLAPR